MSEEKTGRYPQALTFGQKYKVCEVLRNRAEEIMADRPTMVALAEKLSGTLQCHITPRTLRDLCETVELRWEPRHKANGRAAEALREQVEELQRQVAILGAAVRQLYRDLGVVPHPCYGWKEDSQGRPFAETKG